MIETILCPICNEIITDRRRKKYCSDQCKKQARDKSWYEKRKDRLLQQSLCVRCAMKPHEPGKQFCISCLEQANKDALKRLELIDSDGLCRRCLTKKAKSGYKWCEDCSILRRKEHAEYENQKILDGCCTRCGKKKAPNGSKRCGMCVIKNTSFRYTGTMNNWKLLATIFLRQNKTCPYSGRLLTLGVNASLDHIVPRSMGGDNSVANLEWLDKDINTMKSSMNKEEFIALIKQMYSHITTH